MGMATIKIGVLGAAGRMGRMLIREVAEGSSLVLIAATDVPGSAAIGIDAGIVAGLPSLGVAVTHNNDALFEASEVVIDFTLPTGTATHARLAAETKTPLVIGTSGLRSVEEKAIDKAVESIAIVQAPNMSLVANLLYALTQQTADILDDTYDVAISEMHHRYKRDAPSGTALALQAAAEAGGRKKSAIAMTAIRAGDLAGEHTVFFAGEGERLELTHEATSRRVFARGAIHAARWLLDKPPGRYGMKDVLGLN